MNLEFTKEMSIIFQRQFRSLQKFHFLLHFTEFRQEMAVWLLVKRCVYILWNKVLWLTGCTLLVTSVILQIFMIFMALSGLDILTAVTRHFRQFLLIDFLSFINQEWLDDHDLRIKKMLSSFFYQSYNCISYYIFVRGSTDI